MLLRIACPNFYWHCWTVNPFNTGEPSSPLIPTDCRHAHCKFCMLAFFYEQPLAEHHSCQWQPYTRFSYKNTGGEQTPVTLREQPHYTRRNYYKTEVDMPSNTQKSRAPLGSQLRSTGASLRAKEKYCWAAKRFCHARLGKRRKRRKGRRRKRKKPVWSLLTPSFPQF